MNTVEFVQQSIRFTVEDQSHSVLLVRDPLREERSYERSSEDDVYRIRTDAKKARGQKTAMTTSIQIGAGGGT
jgi:hypothetical protein